MALWVEMALAGAAAPNTQAGTASAGTRPMAVGASECAQGGHGDLEAHTAPGRGMSSCRPMAQLHQAILSDLSLDFYVTVRPKCS